MEQTNKLSIDIFSRPLMAAAARDIIRVEAQLKYNESFVGNTKDYLRNAFAYKIEKELIAFGIYKNEAEAFEGQFRYDRDAGVLQVLDADDSDVVTKTLVVSEYPSLETVMAEWCSSIDEMKVDRDFRQAEYKDMHTEAWDKIYSDLVTMGVYPSIEEARAQKLTLKDGRYLEHYREKPRMRDMAEMMREIFG
jgi:hypothetical protein